MPCPLLMEQVKTFILFQKKKKEEEEEEEEENFSWRVIKHKFSN